MILGITISTAFLGPTDHRSSRISVTCKRDSKKTYRKIVSYDWALDSGENHLVAALALMEVIDADTTYDGAEPFRIVARGWGGTDAGYQYIINRGGA